MSITLILTMLRVCAMDGPSVYGGALPAVDAIEELQRKHGAGVTLGQIDSVLRECNVDVQLIAETYARA